MRNIKALFIFALLMTVFGFANAQTNSDKKTHKLIFQLTTGDSLEQNSLVRQLSNITNQSQFSEPLQIEVICYAKGINFVLEKKSKYKADIKRLTDLGVNFIACENTLKRKKLPKTAVMKEATFSPMGVIHLMKRQEQAWTYIKAGF